MTESGEGDQRPALASNECAQSSGDVSAGRLDGRHRAIRRRGIPPWVISVRRAVQRFRTWHRVNVREWLSDHRTELVSYACSLLVLAAVLLLMALWVLPPHVSGNVFDLLVTRVDPDTAALPMDPVEIVDEHQPNALNDLSVNSSLRELLSEWDGGTTPDEMTSIADGTFGVEFVPTDSEMEAVYQEGTFGGRSRAGRLMSVRKFGGTIESEQAVTSGLRWLQKLQQENGSWKFSQVGDGATAGTFRRTEVGATALALLCYLGAGHTHLADGPYRQTVHDGLAYIGSEAVIQQGTADLRGSYEGNSGMYVHALATICVSEALALENRDRDLKKLTEMAVAFIESAQDPFDGGWRYKPRDESGGDTSVLGWQIMALHSARASGVRPSSQTLRLARQFLRDVQTVEDGSRYAYRPGQGERPAMTAVALLSRMYLGWQPDKTGLQRGVESLAARGPSRENVYYNYYAAQVLHHWGGPLWNEWNGQLREQLVRTQIREGPAAGSWPVTDPHGRKAGQLYQTALSLLTLEVYYRYLPLYRRFQPARSDDAALLIE